MQRGLICSSFFSYVVPVAITIVTHDVSKVFCAVVHDRTAGSRFGKLICVEILSAFIKVCEMITEFELLIISNLIFFAKEYATDLGLVSTNLKDYHGFHNKLPEIVKYCVKPILLQCKCVYTHNSASILMLYLISK